MSLLLLIFLTIACLPVDWPEPLFGVGTEGSAAISGVIVAGLLLVARFFSHRTVSRLTLDPSSRESIARGHGLRRLSFFFLNLFGFVLLLVCGWGWTVRHAFTVSEDYLPGADRYLPGAELVILVPYFISLIGSWALFFDAERALHLAAPYVRGTFWTRGGYILYLLRQHLLMVLTPVFLMIAQLGALRAFPTILDSPWAKLAALFGLFGCILLLPSFVPLVLGLQPMPAGRVRERLERAASRLNVRYRGLHIWDTRGNLATAMVTGLFPRLRHIVFTDLLLSTMSDDEIEAVFGHEVGHVKHGHLFYYAAFLMLSFLTLGAAYRAVEMAPGTTMPTGDAALVVTVLTTGIYLFVVFGFISRKCERQADVFGCKTVSCSDPDCIGHGPETSLVAKGRGLCRTGVGIFVRALERVEEINGQTREADRIERRGPIGWFSGALRFVGISLATWQHSTIAKRVAFLKTLPGSNGGEQRFQFQVTLLRWGLFLFLAGSILAVSLWKGWRNLLEGV
ncbi:MAG: hypothetical protein EXS09_09205 [Gemmataceae bacterium]|nr:hypothetical protein [Gemmataceae bacterium]